MIDKKLIIFLSVILTLFSCKGKPVVNVNNDSINNIIRKHHLYRRYENNVYADKNGLGKTLIFSTMYVNEKTDSLLYILKNDKNDILLIHLDKGIDNYFGAGVMKPEKDYVLRMKDFGKIHIDNDNGYYKIDSLVKFFKIDTINRTMNQVKRISDSEIINQIKEHFNLHGDFYMVHSPIEKVTLGEDPNKIYTFITLAKDTLNGYQSYYQIKTPFYPRKMGKDFWFYPDFNEMGKYLGINKIQYLGLFKDNIGYREENRGLIKYRYYYYYLNPDGSLYYSSDDEFRVEIIAKGNIIMTLKKEDFFQFNTPKEIEINGIISEFRPAIFKYYNDEYFITTFLPKRNEYIEQLPPVYHLDTVKWEMDKIELFDPQEDENYSILTLQEILGGNLNDVDSFLDGIEIVKVNDKYKIILKQD